MMTSTELRAWIFTEYEYVKPDRRLRCKRCGQHIYWTTKHSHDVHGVDVEVQPAISTPDPNLHYDDIPGS